MSRTSDLKSIILVAGPTASGKSALAIAVAEAVDGVVINADSMQVYRDLPILTAQPDLLARRRVPHRLYGEIDAAESFSVGAWREKAVQEIAAAHEKGQVPVLAGGTGLYLRALLQGLAAVPPIPDAIRQEARALWVKAGAEAFRELLRAVDPEAAARLGANDQQRLVRAYEVVMATGRTLADWQREHEKLPAFRSAVIVLEPPREELYAAIEGRFLAMLEQGGVEEVEALMARDLPADLPAMKVLGVREIAAWRQGDLSKDEAIGATQQATRNYAKRQYTWLRHQLPEGEALRKLVLPAQFSERLLPEIFSFIRPFLLTRKT